MPKTTFIFYADPGHAWLKVPHTILHELGIAHRISDYSYAKGGNVYLEEDCDARVFIEAYRQRYNADPRIKEVHGSRRSRIRHYPYYQEN